jgi:hypothetical protein
MADTGVELRGADGPLRKDVALLGLGLARGHVKIRRR